MQWIHAKCFADYEDEGGGRNKCCRCLELIHADDQTVGQYGAVRGWFHLHCLELYEERAKVDISGGGGGGKSLGSDYY